MFKALWCCRFVSVKMVTLNGSQPCQVTRCLCLLLSMQ